MISHRRYLINNTCSVTTVSCVWHVSGPGFLWELQCDRMTTQYQVSIMAFTPATQTKLGELERDNYTRSARLLSPQAAGSSKTCHHRVAKAK